MGKQEVIWKPQPGPQTLMLSCPFEEVLYGGAAGGGKTDALLGDYAAGIERYGRAWKGVLFRLSYPMLDEIENRSLEIFGPAYGEKCYSLGNKEWTFPNGAILQFRHLEKHKDTLNYQGQQYAWVGFDELTQWPDDYCYMYMFSRQRSAKGAKCYTRATTNPGGPGHGWVKARFIDPRPPMVPIEEEVDGQLERRVFIPAKVTDNRILVENDPRYISRLKKMSDPTLRSALLDGNWDIFAGQAFPEWNPRIHTIESHAVPEGVTVWRAMDWGFEKPYACLWFYADYDGNVIVCNELYGMGEMPNTGSREPASVVAEKIETIEKEHGWWVEQGFLDPQCWAAHNSDDPSIYDRLGGSRLGWQPWSKGPQSRKNHKSVVHDYLKITNGKSRLRIMRRCRHFIRTFPAIPLSDSDPEDVNTDSEDHLYDALRGGLVKRIMTREERDRINNIRTRYRAKRSRMTGRYGAW